MFDHFIDDDFQELTFAILLIGKPKLLRMMPGRCIQSLPVLTKKQSQVDTLPQAQRGENSRHNMSRIQ